MVNNSLKTVTFEVCGNIYNLRSAEDSYDKPRKTKKVKDNKTKKRIYLKKSSGMRNGDSNGGEKV